MDLKLENCQWQSLPQGQSKPHLYSSLNVSYEIIEFSALENVCSPTNFLMAAFRIILSVSIQVIIILMSPNISYCLEDVGLGATSP